MMTEVENPMEYEEQEEPPSQDEYEDEGGFENDIDINEEFNGGRGRGRGVFR